MGLKIKATFTCDQCGLVADLTEENIDFYSDYSYLPNNIPEWNDCLSLLDWPYEGFPENIDLLCPSCSKKFMDEHPNLAKVV